jgi:microcystin-dependent protein
METGIVNAAAVADGAVAKALVDAKGDLIVATAADTVGRLAVGANDTVPVAASGQSTGILWQKIGNAQIASNAAIDASKLAGYPADPSKTLLGDGSWGTVSAAPVGAVLAFINNTPPTGWLLCDGSAVLRATYSALFTLIGTAYGAGDGSTTFNVPDLRGRVPVGKGSHANVDVLGDNDGSALANRQPGHRHTVTDPGHQHGVSIYNSGGGSIFSHDFIQTNDTPAAAPLTNSATTGISIAAAGASAPLDTPAFVVLNFIIKV